MPFLHRRRVKPAGSDAGGRVGALSACDRATLQSLIDRLHKRPFGIQLFGFLRAEATTLLCAPPNEVYERLTSILSNCSIVGGLVLSALASAALSPLDLSEVLPEKRHRCTGARVLYGGLPKRGGDF